jgi:hypothetical protein
MTTPNTIRDVDPCPALPHNENEVLDTLESVLSIFSTRGHAEVKVFIKVKRARSESAERLASVSSERREQRQEVLRRWGR